MDISSEDFSEEVHYATIIGDLDKLLYFIEKEGLDLTFSDSKKRTLLHFASNGGHLHTVRMLIDRGANINAKDINGNSPLHLGIYRYDIHFKFSIDLRLLF
jgi:ankyrin repeat protein